MNQREPRLTPRESLWAHRYLALLLLPVLAPTNTNAIGRSRSSGPSRAHAPEGSAPYLLAVGPPPLRFQELAPPPDLSTRLPAAAPPSHSSKSTTHALTPDMIPPASETTALPAAVATTTELRDPSPSPGKPAPAAIIPDDTRPPVRPEDFLPFFQIPGTARGPAEVSAIVPVPGNLPSPAAIQPSSATYTQTPR